MFSVGLAVKKRPQTTIIDNEHTGFWHYSIAARQEIHQMKDCSKRCHSHLSSLKHMVFWHELKLFPVPNIWSNVVGDCASHVPLPGWCSRHFAGLCCCLSCREPVRPSDPASHSHSPEDKEDTKARLETWWGWFCATFVQRVNYSFQLGKRGSWGLSVCVGAFAALLCCKTLSAASTQRVVWEF